MSSQTEDKKFTKVWTRSHRPSLSLLTDILSQEPRKSSQDAAPGEHSADRSDTSKFDAVATSPQTNNGFAGQVSTSRDRQTRPVSSTTDEDELIDRWLSPILQNAKIESPREQGLSHSWNSRTKGPRSTIDSATGDDRVGSSSFSSWSHFGRSPGHGKMRPQLAHLDDDESCCVSPGGTKKSVKFGTAKVYSDHEAYSDYFSLPSQSDASSINRSRQSSISGRPCLTSRSRTSSSTQTPQLNEEIIEDSTTEQAGE